jgi:hypothetical protein
MAIERRRAFQELAQGSAGVVRIDACMACYRSREGLERAVY